MAEACTWVPMVHDKKQFSRFLHSPLPTNTNMHAMVWLCMGKTLIEVIDTPPCPHARPSCPLKAPHARLSCPPNAHYLRPPCAPKASMHAHMRGVRLLASPRARVPPPPLPRAQVPPTPVPRAHVPPTPVPRTTVSRALGPRTTVPSSPIQGPHARPECPCAPPCPPNTHKRCQTYLPVLRLF